jgi:hypothetical protein
VLAVVWTAPRGSQNFQDGKKKRIERSSEQQHVVVVEERCVVFAVLAS